VGEFPCCRKNMGNNIPCISQEQSSMAEYKKQFNGDFFPDGVAACPHSISEIREKVALWVLHLQTAVEKLPPSLDLENLSR